MFCTRCEAIRKVFASPICVGFVIATSESPASTAAATAFVGCPGGGDPRVNIQNDKGMAKAYQVRQVLKAIERLQHEDAPED